MANNTDKRSTHKASLRQLVDLGCLSNFQIKLDNETYNAGDLPQPQNDGLGAAARHNDSLVILNATKASLLLAKFVARYEQYLRKNGKDPGQHLSSLTLDHFLVSLALTSSSAGGAKDFGQGNERQESNGIQANAGCFAVAPSHRKQGQKDELGFIDEGNVGGGSKTQQENQTLAGSLGGPSHFEQGRGMGQWGFENDDDDALFERELNFRLKFETSDNLSVASFFSDFQDCEEKVEETEEVGAKDLATASDGRAADDFKTKSAADFDAIETPCQESKYCGFEPIQILLSLPADNGDFVKTSSVDVMIAKQEFQSAIESARGDNAIITLVQIEVLPFSEPPVRTIRNDSSPIQALGNLIHAIFPKSNATSNNFARNHGDAVDGSARSKIQKSGNDSIFFELFETEGFPAPVCRLLSDMIESGKNGNADSPFQSVQEVIRDLEQMLSLPLAFLYDQEHYNTSPQLCFGKSFHGRKSQLVQLLKISTRVEKYTEVSSSGTDDARTSNPAIASKAEAVLISGIAGSGKTHLANQVGNFLSLNGWIVQSAKFEKGGTEYSPQHVVCSIFDKLLSNIVSLKEGNTPADVGYGHRAKEAVLNEFDQETLSYLSGFVPKVRDLTDCNVDDKIAENVADCDFSRWRLVYQLSRLAGTILNLGRKVLLLADDLQWGDAGSISLLSEIITFLGSDPAWRGNVLFIGTYRDTDVTASHPLNELIDTWQASNCVHLTTIRTSSFTEGDLLEILMQEMKLPKRYILELAKIAYQRTAGYVLFAVKFMNSLVRKSVITFDSRKGRFVWDKNKLLLEPADESIDSFFASRMASLRAEDVQTLRILSCFEAPSTPSFIQLLSDCPCVPEGGMITPISRLMDEGILEFRDAAIAFTHDLVKEIVYNSILERGELHLAIGSFIGAKTTLDALVSDASLVSGINNLYLENGSGNSSISLAVLATSQINCANQSLVLDKSQRKRFADWNLWIAKAAAKVPDFPTTFSNCKAGIKMLGEDLLWKDYTYSMSIDFFELASISALAQGDGAHALQYSKAAVENTNFGSEKNLIFQYVLIRSYESSGDCSRGVATGLAVLRYMNLCPSSTSRELVLSTLSETESIMSRYTTEQIKNLFQKDVPAQQKNVARILDAMSVIGYRSAPAFMPLVSCAVVKYSLLNNSLCDESILAFVMFIWQKMSLLGKLTEGQQWGECLQCLLGKITITKSVKVRAQCFFFNFVNFIFHSLKDTALKLEETSQLGMMSGDVYNGVLTMQLSLKFSLFGGQNLDMLMRSYDKHFKLSIKHNKESLKMALPDKLLMNKLLGNTDDPFATFPIGVRDEEALLTLAKVQNNSQLLEQIYAGRFLSAFWFGEFTEAQGWLKKCLEIPSSKALKVYLIFYKLFGGVIAYHFSRGGKGDDWMRTGNEMLERVESWQPFSAELFENKALLLRAEYHASMSETNEAISSFTLSIESAKRHGLIHEQGLAHELLAKFLLSLKEFSRASASFGEAFNCYMQWGAVAKARHLRESYAIQNLSAKRDRG